MNSSTSGGAHPVGYSHTLSILRDRETLFQFVTPLGALTQLESYGSSLYLLFLHSLEFLNPY